MLKAIRPSFRGAKAGFLVPKLTEYFWNTSLVYFILDGGKII